MSRKILYFEFPYDENGPNYKQKNKKLFAIGLHIFFWCANIQP